MMKAGGKYDDLYYTQLSLMPSEEEILEEMEKAFIRTEDKLLRTRDKFMNTMLDTLYETLSETERIKSEFLDTVRELKEQADMPITEKDLPF